jgi:hypothetical protein
MKNKGFNEILILMKLHIRHVQIQFAKVTIGVLDSPILVLFSSVTSGSGNLQLDPDPYLSKCIAQVSEPTNYSFAFCIFFCWKEFNFFRLLLLTIHRIIGSDPWDKLINYLFICPSQSCLRNENFFLFVH